MPRNPVRLGLPGLVAPWLVALGCGGQVVEPPGTTTDAGAPGPDGQRVLEAGQYCCPYRLQVTDGVTCPAPAFPASCPSTAANYGCQGQSLGPVLCTCGSGVWQCSHTSPACPPTPCPSPDAVRPNGVCDVVPSEICPSAVSVFDCSGMITGYQTCTCIGGTWACSDPGVPPSCPPSACPDPDTVSDGVSCVGTTKGLQCPGEPLSCDGVTFYDSLSCDGSTWVTLAATECGLDGGTE